METRITSTQLARELSDILNRVRYRGERFVVVRGSESIAVLAPAGPHLGVTLQEAAERLGDIPFPGEGFADDLEAIHNSQSPVGEGPWDS